MAVTNGYCTLTNLKSELGISDTNSDTKLETAINAASRQIDGFTGRRFWQDATVQDRTYYADDPLCVLTDDISTVTGLIVKADTNDDGTFATTLTITTNFILLPTNSADRTPVWPYTEIRLVDSGVSFFPMSASGRPGVQVTAKFGWPAIPDDITKACLIQSAQLFKSTDAVFGGLSFGDGSFLRVREGLNPMAAALVEPYTKPRVG